MPPRVVSASLLPWPPLPCTDAAPPLPPPPAAAPAAPAAPVEEDPAKLLEAAQKELEATQKAIERGDKVVARAEYDLGQATHARDKAVFAHEREARLLELVKETLYGMKEAAVADLGLRTVSPSTTFRLLRASLIALGKDAPLLASWTAMREFLVVGAFFEELKDYDVDAFLGLSEADRRRIRAYLRGLATAEAFAKMDAETPRSGLGFYLQRLLAYIRLTALALAARRTAEAQLAKVTQDKEAAETTLAENKAKVEELTAKIAELEIAVQAKLEAEAAEKAAAEAAAAGAEGGEAPADE